MLRAFGMGAILFGFWLLLSGHYDSPLLLGLGVGSCALVVWIAHRMEVVDHEGLPLHLGGRVVRYFPWLLKEIAKSNLAVARIVLDPKLPIDPGIARLRTPLRTPLGKVIFANSVTLTPGTITTGVEGDQVEIHALVRSDLEGAEDGEMMRRVLRVEGS
ncbi:MAG TPA: Na+/H+ antiporter subunit E [Longimicrobiales bacterium]|nr:Na+/H+ antiporter subunit E [Longimicrobiales bacterium]